MAARILIVDDEPNIIGTVAPLLRARGYDVFSAMTGRAALEAVERDKPDLIVLDLGLPDMDGVDVSVAVRQSSGVPILVLSARGADGDSMRAPMTMSRSRLAPRNCWRESALPFAESKARRRPANRSCGGGWSSIVRASACCATARKSD